MSVSKVCEPYLFLTDIVRICSANGKILFIGGFYEAAASAFSSEKVVSVDIDGGDIIINI